jgi:hypothetical protein
MVRILLNILILFAVFYYVQRAIRHVLTLLNPPPKDNVIDLCPTCGEVLTPLHRCPKKPSP